MPYEFKHPVLIMDNPYRVFMSIRNKRNNPIPQSPRRGIYQLWWNVHKMMAQREQSEKDKLWFRFEIDKCQLKKSIWMVVRSDTSILDRLKNGGWQ